MSYDYFKPFYLPGVEIVYPLKEFDDYSVEFYRVKYRIRRDCFVSRTGGGAVFPQMQNTADFNGNPLWQRLSAFDRKKYKLLLEERESQAFYDIVSETYGFTPNKIINRPTTTSWTKPGIYDTSTGALSRTMSLASTDEGAETHTISVSNADGKLAAGNVVYMNKAYWTNAGGTLWNYRQRGGNVSILYATSTQIVIPFFTWQVIHQDGTYGSTFPSTSTSGGFYVDGTKTVEQLANVRNPLAGDFPAIRRVEFVAADDANLIDLQNAWTVNSGGQPVDTLSSATSPTLAEYMANVGTSNLLLAQPQSAELLMGDIYKRTSIYVKYQ